MRRRGPFIATGALGICVLAVGAVAVSTGISHAAAIRAIAVHTMIAVSPGNQETFAPPPSGAAPAMTPLQAYNQWEHDTGGRAETAFTANTTVRLGLLTVRVGTYCGAECHGLIVRNGIAYSALNQLAYGYGWPAFAHRHSHHMNWLFLDASTGQMINAVLRERLSSGPPLEPRPKASPPAGNVSYAAPAKTVVCGTVLSQGSIAAPVVYDATRRLRIIKGTTLGGVLMFRVARGCDIGTHVSWVPRSAARLVKAAYASDGLPVAVVLKPSRPAVEFRLIGTRNGKVVASATAKPAA